MDRTRGGAPLLALDAVVVDTETTGLDPRKARVIELAGVRLSAGKLVEGASFRQLIRPGNESIPPSTTDIHGIDDAAGAAAPSFADVWPRFRDYLGPDILIGHTIGFVVHAGQRVRPGQRIALAGDSGAPDGCHLHFEVRAAGGGLSTASNPAGLLRLD